MLDIQLERFPGKKKIHQELVVYGSGQNDGLWFDFCQASG